MDKSKIPILKASLTYGLIIGLASAVLSLLLYFTDQTFEKWALYVGSILFLGLMILMLIFLRKEYGKGFISYGQVVLASILISLVAGIIGAVYNYTIFTMDESHLQDYKYFAIEQIDKRIDKMDAKYQERLDDNQYDRVESELKKSRKKAVDKINRKSIVSFSLGSIINLVFTGLLIGLISGIFLKKKPDIQAV